MRSDVTFISRGIGCAGWLYRPEGDGPAPIVVMAHGFSATRELRLDAYAERFAAAGLGVLLFDYRHFGASGGEPRQLLDIGKQQDDYRAAIDYARSLEWVDPDRVALFGSSFSGGHVLVVAAGDQRIAAVVSQCPYTDAVATLRLAPPRNIALGTVAGLRDLAMSAAGRGPVYMPSVGAPGTFAVMTSPDAQPGFESLVPPAGPSTWENKVAARIMLAIGLYTPGRAARKVQAPILACLCDGDVVTPPDVAERHIGRAVRAEVKRYPGGHFDIYTGAEFESAVADQTAFLVRHLRPAAGPGTATGAEAAGATATQT